MIEANDGAIPTAYRSGHARALQADADLAERYVAHTTIGDPKADAVLAALSHHPAGTAQTWIRLGIERGPVAIPDAPAILRES